MYCCSETEGQFVDGMGRLRARVSLVEGVVNVVFVGGGHSVLGKVEVEVLWLLVMARPINPPTVPAMIAITSPESSRTGHRVHLCRRATLLGPRPLGTTSL